MPEWMKVVVGLTILVIMVSLSMSLFVTMLEEGQNEEGKEKILQIIDRVDEEKWEKLKEEEHERLLDS